MIDINAIRIPSGHSVRESETHYALTLTRGPKRAYVCLEKREGLTLGDVQQWADSKLECLETAVRRMEGRE